MVYFYVGVAGAIGAILRYLISLVPFNQTTLFPYSTLAVNLIGSFFLAWLTTQLFKRVTIRTNIQTAISTGLIGSFTTFSTFSVETVQLFQNGQVLLAVIYVLVSMIGGLFFSYLGFQKEQRGEVE